jgi:hypothetical protein
MLTVLTPTYGSTNDDTGFYTLREDDGRFDEAVLRGEQRRISEPRQRAADVKSDYGLAGGSTAG